MTTRRFYVNAAPQRTLASGINSSVTSLSISGTFAGWPTQFPFYAVLEDGTASVEIISVTNIVGTTATIARGQDGSTAVLHNAGSTLDFAVVAKDFDDANAHQVATSAVHGVAGTLVGTTDTQTLTNKTLTAPTITGGTQTSPTINTPTITKALATGDASNAAVKAKAAAGARAFETQKSDGTTKLTVDGDTGNVATPGTFASGAQTVTGNETVSGSLTAGSLHSTGTTALDGNVTAGGTVVATGNISSSGLVTGGLTAISFTNQAAATTAIPSPSVGTRVYLSAPTGGYAVGDFTWNGTIWEPSRKGRVGSARFLTNLATVSGAETVGHQQSVPLVINHVYRVYFRVWLNATAGNRATIRVRWGSGAITTSSAQAGDDVSFYIPASGSAGRITGSSFVEFTNTVATGQFNVAIGVLTSAGSGDTTIVSSEQAALISIDDVS